MIFPVKPIKGIALVHLTLQPFNSQAKLQCLEERRLSKLISFFFFPRLTASWTKGRKAAFDTFFFFFFSRYGRIKIY